MMHDVVLRPQRILSLCSGAGGLDLGVHDALGGCARTVVYVEHEATACEVLAARIADGALDDAPIWGDLHAFDARPWRGRVDGIIGGYPCQPFSVAGKRLGTADPRHLWPSIERILDECRPRWCFFENVAGHLRLGYFDVVKPGLERLGYRVAEGLFTAAEVGAPHQRERLFILGVADASRHGERGRAGQGGDREWLGAATRHVAHTTFGGQRERGEPSGGDGQPDGRDGALADAAEHHWRRGECGTETGTGQDGERRRRLTSDGGTPLFPPFPPGPGDTDAWQRILAEHPDLAPAVESPIRRVADGLATGLDLSRTARLRLTGNGVVPAQAALAFRTLWGLLGYPESVGCGGAIDGAREKRGGGQLREQVDRWPTPDTQNARTGAMRAEAKGKHAMSLHHVVEGWSHEAP